MEPGTISIITFDCGLARDNPQRPGVLDLFSEPEIGDHCKTIFTVFEIS
jgi:hypothetical protein